MTYEERKKKYSVVNGELQSGVMVFLDIAAVATAIILFTLIHCVIFAGVVLVPFL